ncbi:MAG: hypothetical protein HFH60_03745 [Lachnospiraceae bacterium]|nr:hypothetical protein [Lachnospiraceae bacterium]
MTLNFNETAIVNQTLDVTDKSEYMKKLESLKENTKEKELIADLDSLMDKIFPLSNDDFALLVSDRNANKIFTFPPYYL